MVFVLDPLKRLINFWIPFATSVLPFLRRRSRLAPLPALNSVFDGSFPPGPAVALKGRFSQGTQRRRGCRAREVGSQIPTMHSGTMHLYSVNGAAHRVGKNDTAPEITATRCGAAVIVGADPDSR